jgi:hypothetical protein
VSGTRTRSSTAAPAGLPGSAAYGLAFAAPGLLHALGNALFVIQGRAQVGGGDLAAALPGIQQASKQALEVLELFRCLCGEDAGRRAVQAGSLLRRLCDVLGVAARRHGVGIECAAGRAPTVDPSALCAAVTQAVASLLAQLPAGWSGDLVVELGERDGGVTVRLWPRSARGQLPFPLDLPAAAGRVAGALAGLCPGVASSADRTALELGFGGAHGGG